MKLNRCLYACLFIALSFVSGSASRLFAQRTKAAYTQPIDPAIKAKFDQLIDARFKPDGPGGAVLIAQKGKVLYERGFGMANLELNVKMQPDMLFEIGSQTKQFTTICILRLMEQGKLSVADPISKYIENSPEAWQKISIENLMTHSSGISDLPNGRNLSTAETIEAAKKQPLGYTPGSKTFYANIEFKILGFIVEKLSGQPIGDYLKAHILTPLGMKYTYCNVNDGIIPNRTPAYLKRSVGFTNVATSNSVDGAGGLISNTYDMLIWYEALAAGKLVKKETLERAWKPYLLADGKPSKFGYGWWAGGAVQGSPITEHGGLKGGYSTESLYMPNEQVFVAVFLNQRSYADPVAQELAAIFIGKPYPMDSIKLTDDELNAFTGTYDIGEGQKRKVTLSNGKLTYEGTPKLEIIHYAKDKFYLYNTMLTGTVRRDEQGKITQLEIADNRYLSYPKTLWKKIE